MLAATHLSSAAIFILLKINFFDSALRLLNVIITNDFRYQLLTIRLLKIILQKLLSFFCLFVFFFMFQSIRPSVFQK